MLFCVQIIAFGKKHTAVNFKTRDTHISMHSLRSLLVVLPTFVAILALTFSSFSALGVAAGVCDQFAGAGKVATCAAQPSCYACARTQPAPITGITYECFDKPVANCSTIAKFCPICDQGIRCGDLTVPCSGTVPPTSVPTPMPKTSGAYATSAKNIAAVVCALTFLYGTV